MEKVKSVKERERCTCTSIKNRKVLYKNMINEFNATINNLFLKEKKSK